MQGQERKQGFGTLCVLLHFLSLKRRLFIKKMLSYKLLCVNKSRGHTIQHFLYQYFIFNLFIAFPYFISEQQKYRSQSNLNYNSKTTNFFLFLWSCLLDLSYWGSWILCSDSCYQRVEQIHGYFIQMTNSLRQDKSYIC